MIAAARRNDVGEGGAAPDNEWPRVTWNRLNQVSDPSRLKIPRSRVMRGADVEVGEASHGASVGLTVNRLPRTTATVSLAIRRTKMPGRLSQRKRRKPVRGEDVGVGGVVAAETVTMTALKMMDWLVPTTTRWHASPRSMTTTKTTSKSKSFAVVAGNGQEVKIETSAMTISEAAKDEARRREHATAMTTRIGRVRDDGKMAPLIRRSPIYVKYIF